MGADDAALVLEHAEILADRHLGDGELFGEVRDSHSAVFLDAPGYVLLAFPSENFLAIARFHRARLSLGEAVPADHSSRCQRVLKQ